MTLCIDGPGVRDERRAIRLLADDAISASGRRRSFTTSRRRRKGSIILLASVMMVAMVCMVAFATDLGVVCVARTGAHRSADAAAMAAAWDLLDDDRLKGEYELVYQNMRSLAADYAELNEVFDDGTAIDLNQGNASEGDVVIGRLSDPSNPTENLNTADPTTFNAVTVRIHRSTQRNNAIPLFFARIFGMEMANISADATAIFNDNISGFRVTNSTGNSSLMPFVIHKDAWADMIVNGNGNDEWSYDTESGMFNGPDGIPELVMFPGGGTTNGNGNGGNGNGGNQITPGNFGTVDIGGANNSTSHLRDLIRHGPTQQDMDYHGGSIELNPVTGTLDLGGDTGMSVGMELALDDVVGQPRTIFLYDTVSGNGNGTVFTVVGFVGIRIVDFKLNGSNKYIQVQPTYVSDPTAISGDAGTNYYVGQPVHLVR